MKLFYSNCDCYPIISALAVYHRSPAAYEALKSFKIIQLPSSKSLKKFSSRRIHSAGITKDTHEYIEEQEQKYKKYADEMVRGS